MNATNVTAKIANTDFPNICIKPSKFRYLILETIKNAKDKTINKNIKGGGKRVYFLYIKIKEASMPPLIVVGKP